MLGEVDVEVPQFRKSRGDKERGRHGDTAARENVSGHFRVTVANRRWNAQSASP